MKWRGRRGSRNIEDRRGQSGYNRGRMRLPLPRGRAGRRGGGIGLIIAVLVMMYFGVDPSFLLQQQGGSMSLPEQSSGPYQPTAEEQELAAFTSVVLADTEDVWNARFRAAGQRYQEPRLVLFSSSTRTACGQGQSAMGPFYCPADQQVYIDLSFFRDLRDRFGAPGDFAQAYVIAHEVGHHIQTILGTNQKVQRAQRRASKAEANALSVRLELQADCLAGVWAHHAQRSKQVLEPGDIDEALNAANAIGDDRLQQQSRGRIVPESFTHGTSAQRQYWFRHGYTKGAASYCDTFANLTP